MPNSKKKISYTSNLVKEAKQGIKAWNATLEASNQVGPGTDSRANRLAKKEDKARGQFLGALLQGRRYNDKTGKQIKKSTAPAMPKTGPLVKIAKKAKGK